MFTVNMGVIFCDEGLMAKKFPSYENITLMVVVAWFNTLETWFGPGQFSLYSMSDADFHMVCL